MAGAPNESREYLQTIIDTAPVCIKLISVEGIVLTMNQAGLTMIEADSIDQVKGRSVFGLVAPEYHESFKAFGEKISKGGTGSFEFEMVSLKGRRLWLETRAVPLRNERDEIIALNCITHDIRERKQAEEALQDSEERFRTLFESADDGIFLVDGPVFVDCNSRGVEMYGFDDKSEIIGHSYLDFAPSSQPDGESSEEMALRVIPAVLNGSPQKFNWTSLHRDGTPFDSELSLNRINLKGKTYIQAIVRDITARKQSEEALQTKNVLLSAQQEATLDGILMVDPDGKIISYNKRFIEIWNIPIPQEVEDTRSDELALKSVLRYLEKPDEFLERVNYLYEHRTETCRDEIQLKDGRTLDRYTSPMFGADGRYYGRVWYFRDITEKKNLERQRADFYAMVTHDLKSPLTAILGYSSLIVKAAKDKADNDIEEMAKATARSGVKLMRLADDFLAAGMEPGCILIKLEPVDVAVMLTEVYDDFMPLARQTGIVFKADISDQIPVTLLDKKHMERAVGNLLQNALNYTPEGGNVTLKAEAISGGPGKQVIVSVSDTGPGVAPEERGKIFDKYYRSNKTAGIKGTGLGLAIVKAVAEAHGGRVELESEQGKGSTFRLLIPVDQSR